MAETKISQLTISPSIDGTEYLIVDNTEVTRRTQINSLSSVYVVNSKFNNLFNIVSRFNGGPLVSVLNLSAGTYTLQLSNLGTGNYIRKSHTSNHTLIIPTLDSVPFPIGSTFIIRNMSANTLTISASPSIILSYSTVLSTNILEQNASAQLVCVGINSWDIN